MPATVFVWNMFKYRKPDSVGVGHASMFLRSPKGAIYISFWPAEHSLRAGLSSPATVHFMKGDRAADGNPDWASKPISNLDEAAIIHWWSRIQHHPLLDYKHPTPFQRTGAEPAEKGQTYSILTSQCSITVVKALLVGADERTRSDIWTWLRVNSGSTPVGFHVPTITPRDVRELVEDVF